jgi:RHS repeat-associated protein
MNIAAQDDLGYETVNTYYYHPDHLGSSQLVTDYQGKEYQRVEYTPFGESWIDKRSDGAENLPYKFTGKERDTETGLYYYGARYYNPSSSTWLSPDPALGDYIPVAPVDESALRHNENLPGLGGVFNPVNLAVYHYAGNNPVRYTDPDGFRQIEAAQTYGDEFIASDGIVRSSHYLDERVAEISKTFVGGTYLLGGEKPSTEGGKGIDCSANALISAERASGVSIKDRTANDIAHDKKLVQPGNNQPGSLNLYDWNTQAKPNGDGKYEHVTVNTNDGNEVHPSSNGGIIKLVPQSSLDSYAGKKANFEFNWRYILSK